MKFPRPLPSLLLLALTSFAAVLHADEKPASVPPVVPAAPSSTIIEEKTSIAVLPDPALDKMEGKIDRIDAEKKQLLLRTKLGKEPIPYLYNPATQYLDLDGKPVDPRLLLPETPVQIKFVEDRNELIAETVIVQRVQAPLPGGGTTLTTRETLKPGGKVIEQSVKTTTISRTGTVRQFEPGFITVIPEGEAHPVRYQYSENTTWVNAKGQPVPVEIIKAGYPVKVSSTKLGDVLVAEQVIVLTPPAAPVPVPVPQAPGEK